MILVSTAWAATLTGRVMGPDGPVARATVVAYDRDYDYHYDVTDSRGEFAVEDVEPRWWRIRAIPPAGSSASEAWLGGPAGPCGAERIPVGGDVDVGDVDLPAGAVVSGRVLDEEGAPVSGADVTIVHAEADATWADRGTTTGADGTWSIPGVSPGLVGVFVDPEVQPRQWLPGAYDAADAEVVTVTGDTDLGDVSLLPGITVGGSVSGPDGPVGGGDVTVYVPSMVTTVPIVDGRFEATGLPPGTATGWAQVDGYGYTYWPDRDRPGEWLDVPEEGGSTDALDFVLPYESRVTGRLAGTGDRTGGAVLLWNDALTVAFGAPLAADGAFEITKLHPGTYQLVVFAGDIGYVDDVARDAAGEPLSIEVGAQEIVDVGPLSLPREAAVQGRITEDGTGLPVKGAIVRVASQEDSFGAWTDADGRYRVGGITAGTYRITVETAASCPEDEDWVDEGFDGDRSGQGQEIALSAGDHLVVAASVARDDDHDGMADAWEGANDLDPHGDDSAFDPDGDGYDNGEEYVAGTNPHDPPSRSGCAAVSYGPAGWAALLAALVARRRPSYPVRGG